jgi:hypothetical protein
MSEEKNTDEEIRKDPRKIAATLPDNFPLG